MIGGVENLDTSLTLSPQSIPETAKIPETEKFKENQNSQESTSNGSPKEAKAECGVKAQRSARRENKLSRDRFEEE